MLPGKTLITTDASLNRIKQIEYNKAIDDFAESVKNLIADSSVIKFKDIDEIAEQLKGAKQSEDFK